MFLVHVYSLCVEMACIEIDGEEDGMREGRPERFRE